ncbi:GAF domain-containing protein [Fulvivirga ligni]|uniref:GAF domain-containing protein n=1 Tax=Fulvivirga ligni TaxID=2904246 RepID=UPI001F2A90CF|nr:GAF domain-containing protein [Fulvivirga ligni]UII23096.1 GAF domain-containing protein [Fulvivirga ligni]
MELKFRKLNIALISLYVAGMLFTAYVLFQLQDDLIYQSGVINISQLPAAQPVFFKLYIVAGITLLLGLGSLVIALSNSTQEVIYVEKKKNSQSANGASTDENGDDEHSLDLNAIKTLLAKETEESKLAKNLLHEVCKQMEAGLGAFYKAEEREDKRILSLKASYALALAESQTLQFEFGEGLVGQTALEKKTILIDDIPDGYIKIVSGLGASTPTHLLIVPIIYKDELHSVVEIASFTSLGKTEERMVNDAFRQFTQALEVLEKESKMTYQLKKPASDKSKGNNEA